MRPNPAKPWPNCLPDSVQVGLFDAPGARASRLLAAEPGNWPVLPDWQPLLDAFWSGEEGSALLTFLRARLATGVSVYPQQPLRALALVAPADVRVVILGQDPYHGPGQAEGLAFSVAPGKPLPPSLRNIFLEVQRDLGISPPANGSLVRWARQGVLLLNTCLTVEDGQPASHVGRGWETLTDRLLALTAQGRPKAFLLWGAHAQKKTSLLTGECHAVLRANHPSPLSARRPPAPFVGCGHFSATNRWLCAQGQMPIDW